PLGCIGSMLRTLSRSCRPCVGMAVGDRSCGEIEIGLNVVRIQLQRAAERGPRVQETAAVAVRQPEGGMGVRERGIELDGAVGCLLRLRERRFEVSRGVAGSEGPGAGQL